MLLAMIVGTLAWAAALLVALLAVRNDALVNSLLGAGLFVIAIWIWLPRKLDG